MATPLNILIVEDSPDDAELLLIELRRAGFDPKWKRVETESDFLAELKKSPDIILSDFSMPQFTGLRAAELLRESDLHIPFILISGTVGEDIAVEAMKHGATDYLLKDRIVRLGSAVRQTLEKEQLRQESEKLRREIIMREQRLNAFFTGAIAGLALLDLELRYVQINATLADMNGLAAKEHIGRTIREVLPKFAPLFEPICQKVLTTGEPVLNVELTGETPKQPGVQRHWAESIFPTMGKNGKPDGLGVIVVEITERKRVELALRESEEKFRKIFENVQDVFYQTDTDGNILEISPSIERYSGYRRGELIGRPVEEVYHNQEDRARLLKILSEKGEVVDYELQLKTKDGSLVYTSVNAHILIDSKGKPGGVEGALRDITARKQAEAALAESEAKFRAIFEQAGIGLAIVDCENGSIQQCNPALAQMLGYSVEELCRLTVEDVSDPEDYAKDLTQWQQMVNGKHSRFQMEKRYHRKHGEIMWGMLTSTLVRNEAGQPGFIIGMVEDITERKRAEEAIRNQLNELQRWHEVMLGREERILELKREVNELLDQRHLPPRYSDPSAP